MASKAKNFTDLIDMQDFMRRYGFAGHKSGASDLGIPVKPGGKSVVFSMQLSSSGSMNPRLKRWRFSTGAAGGYGTGCSLQTSMCTFSRQLRVSGQ